MTQAACISTREAADRLQVHARTVRKWIDTFEEYICPDLNERGHYVLTEDSFMRLMEIKKRLQEPHKSMRQVRDDLLREGKVEQALLENEIASALHGDTERKLNRVLSAMENVSDMMEDMFERIEQLEDHMYGVFESFEDIEHKLTTVNQDSSNSLEIQKTLDDIRKKQDQLRIELRSINFTNKLSSTMNEQNLLPRRQQKKSRIFGIF